jgi:hypothetical protein
MDTGFFLPGIKRAGYGVGHPPHLVPKLKKEEMYLLLSVWAFVACFAAKCTFTSVYID